MTKLEGLTLGACALFAIALGCGPERTRVSGNGNSETHFLAPCTDQCAGGLECVCGVCTKACETTSDCRGLASAAECSPACSAAPEDQMCDLPCGGDLDCRALGASFTCQAGHCREQVGAGGAGGSGGTGGTSGAGRGGGTSGRGGTGNAGGTDTSGGAAGDAAGATSGSGGGSGAAGTGGNAGTGGSGGASGDGGTGATVVTDVASFHLAEFEALCQQLLNCGGASEDDIFFKLSFPTQASCVDLLAGSPLYLAAQRDLDEKVRSGSIELLLDQVPACLDALRACPPFGYTQGDTPACRAVFRGSSPVDGPCSRSEDCDGDARCVIDAECPGHCTARAALDETCASTADCDDRAGRVVCGDSNTCLNVTVHEPSPVDGPCTPSTWAASDVTPCVRGLYCQATDGADNAGICRGPVAKDGDCTDIELCPEGQACIFADPDTTGGVPVGTCRTVEVITTAGRSCDKITTFCSARLVCADGTCQDYGDGTEGAPCRPLDYGALTGCNSGLVCLDPEQSAMPGLGGYTWGTCGKPRAASAPCQENDDCASQHCGADKTCGDAYCCGEYSCQSN